MRTQIDIVARLRQVIQQHFKRFFNTLPHNLKKTFYANENK